jgi:hypothetical protein
MRTCHLICIALVVMLLAAATGFANTSAQAYADSPNTSDFDQDRAGFSIIVTVAGTYDWSYSLYAYARVMLIGTDPSGTSGQSLGTASVSGIASDSAYATAYLSGTCGTDYDDDSASDDKTEDLIVGNDLTFSELSAAYAGCGCGPAAVAASSYTSASGSIE